MTWWNDFVNWLSSTEGSRIVSDAILPFLAIVIAGVIAAFIARSMGKRLLDAHEREATSAAITSLVSSARKSTTWATLGHDERQFAQHLGDEAAVRLRLLPIPGAGLAATWAEHEIVAIKANSATFTFQAEQTFNDLRDRLIEWQAKPGRARRLFRYDLERWRVEEDAASASGAAPAVGPSAAEPAVAEPTAAEPGLRPAAAARPAGDPAPTSAYAPPAAPAVVSAPAEPAPAEPAAAEPVAAEHPSTKPGPMPVDSAVPEEEAPAAPTRTPVVSPPVVQPPRELAPASPSDVVEASAATDGADSDPDREPAFSAPVSAGQVRRRTSPDSH